MKTDPPIDTPQSYPIPPLGERWPKELVDAIFPPDDPRLQAVLDDIAQLGIRAYQLNLKSEERK